MVKLRMNCKGKPLSKKKKEITDSKKVPRGNYEKEPNIESKKIKKFYRRFAI